MPAWKGLADQSAQQSASHRAAYPKDQQVIRAWALASLYGPGGDQDADYCPSQRPDDGSRPGWPSPGPQGVDTGRRDPHRLWTGAQHELRGSVFENPALEATERRARQAHPLAVAQRLHGGLARRQVGGLRTGECREEK